MRSVLTQDHPTNVRDLMLNYGLDQPGKRVIDFTAGKDGFWEIDYPYKCEIVKCDAVPQFDFIKKKDLTKDDYSELGLFDAGFFDPPYLRGRQGTDYNNKQENGKNIVVPANLQGKRSWSAGGELERYMTNRDDQEFIDRVKGVDRACRQCFKPGALLFVKVQDTRDDGYLVLNHVMVIENLPSFRPYALYVYLKSGGQTWKHHSETSHGFYVVMKYVGSGDGGDGGGDDDDNKNVNRNYGYKKQNQSLPNHAWQANLQDFYERG